MKRTEAHRFIEIETGHVCTVVSQLKNGKHHVVFRGWNPFPCYSMETSFKTLRDWLSDNGWIELAGVTIVIEKED